MANQEQVERLKAGVGGGNKWRKQNLNERIDLENADLRGANLGLANLRDADLREADLREAFLIGAFLMRADLMGADLSGAILSGAFLTRADLSGANLRRAFFIRTDLTVAHLRSVKVEQTIFDEALSGATDFSEIDLSQAIGLDKIRHDNRSTIGTDTLKLSKAKIPEVFLRGCGLSDWEIESAKLYNPDLSVSEVNEILYRMYDLRATQAIQINPLFISYSHSDGEFVDEIEKHLNEKGIRFWRDIHKAAAGRLEKIIDTAIRQNPIVLLVLSENSVKSDWVEHEARKARELEKKTGRDVLCPVALDDSWKDCRWPERLREQIMEYNIMDFSNWRDGEEFGRKFAKLMEGLDLFYKK
jgi:uncharacterized protein YjbI with pentapeptide repeats